MQKLRKRKDFLAQIPNDLFIKLSMETGNLKLSIKEIIESHLTTISKQPDIKNISYYKNLVTVDNK